MTDLMLMGAGSSAATGAPPATERGVVGFGSGFSTTADGVDYYIPLGGVGTTLNTTQANGAYPWRGAGTFRNLYVTVSANTRAADSTLVFQKAGSDQTLTVTIPASGGAATISDTTHSFTVADGDLIGVKITTGAGGGTLTVRSVTAQFETAGQIFTHTAGYGFNNSSVSTVYYAPRGSGASLTSEASSSVLQALESMTASYMHALVTVNSAATTATFKSQDNTADGNQTFTMASGVTGLGEDTNGAHTDTIGAGETLTVQKSSTTGAITVMGVGFKTVNATAKCIQVGSLQSGNATSGGTFYGGMFGPAVVSSAESQASQKMPYAATFSKLNCYVATNASATDATITLRFAGVDQAVTCLIPALTSGFMTASASTANCAVGDLISYKITGQTGTIAIAWVGMLVEDIT